MANKSPKNSVNDSASRDSENHDWDLSSLDQSRGGSPNHSAQSPVGSPSLTSCISLSDPNHALASPGPVSDDKKHLEPQSPVSDDKKLLEAQSPVSGDKKHPDAQALLPSNATATRPSASFKPIMVGESTPEDDECFVVDEDGNRVSKGELWSSAICHTRRPQQKKQNQCFFKFQRASLHTKFQRAWSSACTQNQKTGFSPLTRGPRGNPIYSTSRPKALGWCWFRV